MCHCAEKQERQDPYTYAYAYEDKTIASTAAISHTNTEETRQRRKKSAAKSFGRDCALSRVYFYEAADATRSLRLCFLAQPRTLSLSWDVFDDAVFDFDSWRGERRASAPHNYGNNNNNNNKNSDRNNNSNNYRYGHGYRYPIFPQWGRESRRLGDMIDVLLEAWKEFLERGDHQFGPVKIFSGPGWGWEDEGESRKDEDKDDHGDEEQEEEEEEGDKGVDVSEWDDADTPIPHTFAHPHPPHHHHPDEHISIVAASSQHGDNNNKRPREKDAEEKKVEEEEFDFDLDFDFDFDLDFDFIDDLVEEDPLLRNNTPPPPPPPCVEARENEYQDGRARGTPRRGSATKTRTEKVRTETTRDASAVDGAEPHGSVVLKDILIARAPPASCSVRAQQEEPWAGRCDGVVVLLDCLPVCRPT